MPGLKVSPTRQGGKRGQSGTQVATYLIRLLQKQHGIGTLDPLVVLTNAWSLSCGRKQTWYSLFVSGGW